MCQEDDPHLLLLAQHVQAVKHRLPVTGGYGVTLVEGCETIFPPLTAELRLADMLVQQLLKSVGSIQHERLVLVVAADQLLDDRQEVSP